MTPGRLELARSPEEIGALRRDWESLVVASPTSTPYDHPDFAMAVGRLAPRGGAPLVALWRARHGEPLALLALRGDDRSSRFRNRTLRGVAGWHVSFSSLLARPDAPEAFGHLVTALRTAPGWDTCDLRWLRHDPDWARSHGRWAIEGTPAMELRRDDQHPGGMRCSPKLQRQRRKLERTGALEFTLAGPNDLEATLARFTELHTARWRDTRGAAEFADTAGQAILRELIVTPAAGITPRVGALRMDGQMVAVHLAFVWRDVQYSWRHAYAPVLPGFSPGMLLMEWMLQRAFADGCPRCELGRGDEGFKSRWDVAAVPLHRLVFRADSLRGRLLRQRDRWRHGHDGGDRA